MDRDDQTNRLPRHDDHFGLLVRRSRRSLVGSKAQDARMVEHEASAFLARDDSESSPWADHSETKAMMKDPIVEAVDRASQEHLKRYGGINGLIEHLQAMDRARLAERKR